MIKEINKLKISNRNEWLIYTSTKKLVFAFVSNFHWTLQLFFSLFWWAIERDKIRSHCQLLVRRYDAMCGAWTLVHSLLFDRFIVFVNYIVGVTRKTYANIDCEHKNKKRSFTRMANKYFCIVRTHIAHTLHTHTIITNIGVDGPILNHLGYLVQRNGLYRFETLFNRCIHESN